MKNVFFVFKRKWIFGGLAFFVAVCGLASYFSVRQTSIPKPQYSIVIDVGHGGRDGGAVGVKSGITESELNLRYADTLKDLCQQYGIGVVMTRSDMNGLYDESASNKKRSEMEKRRKIINSSGADLMVSIHMNSFSLPSCKGAYVFYAKGSEEGFSLAKSIQTSLCGCVENARNYVTVGDYFVLNYSSIPSALVECGFLSSPEEESLLLDDSYRQTFCYGVLCGILSYFKN
ncbi:MAG: N-acetylmuramoyl-L-alanine amidase [Clostridiales bacterium]|nr:N-acetylmuramoyl-L-alanine amidase [Clostridiales bacterium]